MTILTTKILRNFNSLLNNRGINVEYYNDLLNLPNDLLIDKLVKLNKSEERPKTLNKLLEFNEEDYHNSLTLTTTHKDSNILLYWSSIEGKTIKIDEIKTLLKISKLLKLDHIFVVTVYDKRVKDSYPNIEFFSFTDLLYDMSKQVYTPKAKIIDYEVFISINPTMNKRPIPTINSDDPLVRYVGGKVGQVLVIERYTLLSGILSKKTLTYRRIIKFVNPILSKATGISVYNIS